jgi:hypothetical protein
MRVYDWDPIRAEHYGQRPHRPHKQAGHMTAPDQCCNNVRKFLPGRRPHMTQSGSRDGLQSPATLAKDREPQREPTKARSDLTKANECYSTSSMSPGFQLLLNQRTIALADFRVTYWFAFRLSA